MEGVGCQDTCCAPTVHDYEIGEGEGEGRLINVSRVFFIISLCREPIYFDALLVPRAHTSM